MILYVESNFVLELAREQDEHMAASELLRLAETGGIELAFPAIALCEPFSAINKFRNDRARFIGSLQRQVADLDRSVALKSHAAALRPFESLLLKSHAMKWTGWRAPSKGCSASAPACLSRTEFSRKLGSSKRSSIFARRMPSFWRPCFSTPELPIHRWPSASPTATARTSIHVKSTRSSGSTTAS